MITTQRLRGLGADAAAHHDTTLTELSPCHEMVIETFDEFSAGVSGICMTVADYVIGTSVPVINS